MSFTRLFVESPSTLSRFPRYLEWVLTVKAKNTENHDQILFRHIVARRTVVFTGAGGAVYHPYTNRVLEKHALRYHLCAQFLGYLVRALREGTPQL
jgi:hypothetical protein